MPDLTTLGKVIGGGLPIAAYGGRRDIMSYVAPSGPIYQAGTLSGNPLAVAAGLAMLRHLARQPEIYDQLEQLTGGNSRACAPGGVTVNRHRLDDDLVLHRPAGHRLRHRAKPATRERFARFFHAMLDRGIYLPPSQFEALFVSAAHTEADITRTLEAAREAFEIALAA